MPRMRAVALLSFDNPAGSPLLHARLFALSAAALRLAVTVENQAARRSSRTHSNVQESH